MILKWMDRFAKYLPVILVNSEIKQFSDILLIGLAKVRRQTNRQVC